MSQFFCKTSKISCILSHDIYLTVKKETEAFFFYFKHRKEVRKDDFIVIASIKDFGCGNSVNLFVVFSSHFLLFE
jgi:hypothetical protein